LRDGESRISVPIAATLAIQTVRKDEEVRMRTRIRNARWLAVLPALMLAAPLAAAAPMPASSGHVHFIQKSSKAGTLNNGNVAFSGRRITIPVVAVAPGSPDKTFELHGKVNPTIVLPAGAKLRIKLADADHEMPHGLGVTRKAPPYPENAKAEIKPPIAGTGIVQPSESAANLHVKSTGWFTLKPGTYYYVCPVPGHAKDGMYGKIVVQASGQ